METEISIIIPCRNEERHIGACLESVIRQDCPKDRIEVLVVDGMSEDGTRGVVEGYARVYPFIKLLDNPKRIIPAAMNIGIRNARGRVIMKVDAHTAYGDDYVSKCVRYLDAYKADNVGGLTIAVPRDDTPLGRAIVIALSHRFGIGNAHHRLPPKGLMWADTAYSGCYRREVFDRVGLYDENIARSEDVAINSRIREAGGRILLVPEIACRYYARSKFSDFCRHNLDNGFWITYPLKFGRAVFSWRHMVPLAFVSALLGMSALSMFYPASLWPLLVVLASYTVTCGCLSVRIAARKRDFRYMFLMPLVFASLHAAYGAGSLWGLLKAALPARLFNDRMAVEENA